MFVLICRISILSCTKSILHFQKKRTKMRQKKITIEIPDDLSEKDEAILVMTKLAKKMNQHLNSGTAKTQKRIGNQQIDGFKFDTSTIEIKRIPPKQKLSAMLTCSCGTLFNKKEGATYHTNYGGNVKKVTVCSTNCRDIVLSNFGNSRVAIKKAELKPMRFW